MSLYDDGPNLGCSTVNERQPKDPENKHLLYYTRLMTHKPNK